MAIISTLSIYNPGTGNTLTFDGQNFILQSISGLEFPSIRLPHYNLPGQYGGAISNQLYGERTISIKGVVNAPNSSPSTYLANRASLQNILSIATNSTGALLPLTLNITLINGNSFTTNVYTSKELTLAFGIDMTDYGDFQLQFIAPDPRLYSTTQSSYTVTLPGGGGTAIATPIPISLSPSTGGYVTVVNSGALPVYPIITINPPVTNPYIYNLASNTYIGINYTLSTGNNPLIINCQAETIYQGANNVTGIQTTGSTFFEILPGNNVIGFNASSGSGTALITYYIASIGI